MRKYFESPKIEVMKLNALDVFTSSIENVDLEKEYVESQENELGQQP